MLVPEKVIDRVIKADCRKEENINLIIKVLKKLPFCKNGDTSIEHLEKVLNKYDFKYGYKLGVIIKTVENKQIKYTVTILSNAYIKEYISGLTIWECFAKACICMYWLQCKEKG